MDRIRNTALFCVGRAVMFGWLAIAVIMFSFSFNPVIALRAGAMMSLGMAAVLLVKAYMAGAQNPRRTEVWIYLDEKTRPFNDQAKQVFAGIMRETYGRFAQWALVLGCIMFVGSMTLLALGFKAELPKPVGIG